MRPAWFAGIAVIASALVSACGPAVGTTATGADSGDDDSSTSAGTTMTTSADSTSPTTTATTTTATTTASTTDTTTTGTPVTCESDWTIGCPSYCAALITCDPSAGVYEECVMDCIAESAESGAECQFSRCLAFSCYGALDCATLEAGSPECNELSSIAIEVCGGSVGCYFSSGDDTCEYGCPDLGQVIRCDGTGCVCEQNGELVATCQLEGACADVDQLPQIAQTCCHW